MGLCVLLCELCTIGELPFLTVVNPLRYESCGCNADPCCLGHKRLVREKTVSPWSCLQQLCSQKEEESEPAWGKELLGL